MEIHFSANAIMQLFSLPKLLFAWFRQNMFCCVACFEINTSSRYERTHKIKCNNISLAQSHVLSRQWWYEDWLLNLTLNGTFWSGGNKIINTGNKRKEGKERPAFMQKEDCRLLRYSVTRLWDIIVQIVLPEICCNV